MDIKLFKLSTTNSPTFIPVNRVVWWSLGELLFNWNWITSLIYVVSSQYIYIVYFVGVNNILSIPSPNIGSSNEPKEPPSKKVCVDDPSNSPSIVPPIDLPDLADIKPDISLLNPYSRPQQHIPEKDIKPNIEDFKPQICLTSPPSGLGKSLSPLKYNSVHL